MTLVCRLNSFWGGNVSRFNKCLLSCSLLSATMTASSVTLWAQQQAASPVSPSPATNITQQPVSPPTPEQLGDALMAHQRYQAALDAYKKAPSNDATVFNKMGIAY